MAVNKNFTIPKIEWEREDTATTLGLNVKSELEIDVSDVEMRNGETRGNTRLDYRLGMIYIIIYILIFILN